MSPKRKVKLGVIELHSNPDLRRRFYEVTDDLTQAAAIVDLWIMDIASVLKEFGYELTLRSNKPAPKLGD